MKIKNAHATDCEAGSVTIVEYTIVLPLTMVVVCILVFAGYLMFDKASLEAATERTALYVSKAIEDPNYVDVADGGIVVRSAESNEIDDISIGKGSIKTHPYRYLWGNIDQQVSDAEKDARSYILKNQLLKNDSVRVSVDVQKGIFPKVTVSATETFEMIPAITELLGMSPLVEIETKSVVYINEPAEFIRNADFAIDIVSNVFAGLGRDTGSKIETVKSRISFFEESTQ